MIKNENLSIKINDYIDEICEDKINSLYNLYAITTHEGNLEFGHYRSCIKIIDTSQWYEFNDSIVKKIILEDSLFENDEQTAGVLQQPSALV